jgi:hypothetical protein
MQIRTVDPPRIRRVENKKDLRAFIDLPYRLYRKDPVWVAPLRSEQWSQFDARSNPLLDHCTYRLFLLEDGGQVIGRIGALERTHRPVRLI